MQKSCQFQSENIKYGKIYIFILISVGYNLSLKNDGGIKFLFSTAPPFTMFTIFNLLGINFNNLLIFILFFKYEGKFNILNPGYAVS